VQRADNFRDIHGLDISNAGTYGLGLNVEVWLSGIAGVSYLGNLLAELDLIANLDLYAARAEMSHQQIAPDRPTILRLAATRWEIHLLNPIGWPGGLASGVALSRSIAPDVRVRSGMWSRCGPTGQGGRRGRA
jgi:hypothetical protein